ncbi:MAG TPA: ubiquinone/menaquinone biosynthesis methyltransferase [Vicinamibacterales bacterium]|nr:ubiquinone/menaquinone biosynthesis methyltransferase [Vicinamibacterales bacterium]
MGAEPLSSSLSTPESKRRYVRRLFATIADRYDFITIFLSYGRDRAWKRRVFELSGAGPGTAALDLACGTGDLTFGLQQRGASACGLDITERMVQLARAKRSGEAPPRFVVGDMMALPFADARFDVVTTGYGLRNVPALAGAIDEIRRVLRSGGTFVSLDFDRPPNHILRAIYLAYLTVVGSALGWVLHRDPDTYRYIPESIARYPGSVVVAEMFAARGFADIRVLPVFGGFMAIHVARRAE